MRTRDATTGPSTDGATRHRREFLVSVLIAVSLLEWGCAGEPPRSAALGEAIAVGPYAIEVPRARLAADPPPPISAFRRQPGKKVVVVFVHWKTIDANMDLLRRLAVVEAFLTDHLSISDSQGNRTAAFSAMQENTMYMEDPGANWRDWVVVFHVPEESQQLSLIVENPEPRDGQSRYTTTPLGI